MKSLHELQVELFADGANLQEMLRLNRHPLIKGFTTNPTLMKQAGVRDYEGFAQEILQQIADLPISFEVFSDDIGEMEEQAHRIAAWAENVFVKVPVSNTQGKSTVPLLARLAEAGIKVNVTALMTLDQVSVTARILADGPPAFVSVFAGRIADTGRDPVPLMTAAAELVHRHANLRLIWASPREILNIFHANQAGCDVITATADILKKLHLVGKNLEEYSLETVRMFHEDALSAGFRFAGECLAVSTVED
jgi:transaldolase